MTLQTTKDFIIPLTREEAVILMGIVNRLPVYEMSTLEKELRKESYLILSSMIQGY